MEHFRWQLTTSGSGRIVSAIPAWCVYESTGFHLGNIGIYIVAFQVSRAFPYIHLGRPGGPQADYPAFSRVIMYN